MKINLDWREQCFELFKINQAGASCSIRKGDTNRHFITQREHQAMLSRITIF